MNVSQSIEVDVESWATEDAELQSMAEYRVQKVAPAMLPAPTGVVFLDASLQYALAYQAVLSRTVFQGLGPGLYLGR